MHQNIYRLALALLALFGVEILVLTYWQVARSADLWTMRGNRRAAMMENRIARGSLLDRNGEALARSRFVAGRQQRETVDPVANAHVAGYLSPRFGRFGLEGKYNSELSGARREWTMEEVQNQLLSKPMKGNDVFTTLDRRLQVAAFKALSATNRRGAVVAIAPATGEVLALVSLPSYDPNRLDANWEQLTTDRGKPLVPRATLGLYPPGSAFKIVTYAANAQTRAVPLNATYDCNGALPLDSDGSRGKYVVHESEGHAHGRVDLPMALARSCNIAFAQIAMSIGATQFEKVTARFGLGERLPFALPLESALVRRERNAMTRNQLAQSGFGQGQVTVTPLHMALIAAALANRGVMMEPQIVHEIRSYEGKVLQHFPPRAWRQVVSEEAARATLEAMKLTTTKGTAAGMFDRLPFTVGGKTGTAQNPHGRSHAWFVCVAPADQPRIAIAVLVENGGYGARTAAPIARRVLQEWSIAGLTETPDRR